jgi:hypothetical protein
MTRGVKVSPEEHLEARRLSDLRHRARARGFGDDIAGYQASFKPRAPRAVIVPAARPIDLEAEAQAAREAEIETHTIQIAAQLQQLPLNRWVQVATASSLGIAIAVAVQLDHRWQRDGRTLIHCQHRDCDLYVLRQATVTQ